MRNNILLIATACALAVTSCKISVDSQGLDRDAILNSLTEEYSNMVFETIRNLELSIDIDNYINAGGADAAAGTDFSYVGEEFTAIGDGTFRYDCYQFSKTNLADAENGGTGLFDHDSQWKITFNYGYGDYGYVITFAGDSTWKVTVKDDRGKYLREGEMTLALMTRSNGRCRLWTADFQGAATEDSEYSASMRANEMQTYLVVYDRQNIFNNSLKRGVFNAFFYKDGKMLLEKNLEYNDEIPM